MAQEIKLKVASADINEKAATDLVTRLIEIPGKSGEEGAVVEFITGHLRDLGIPASAIQTDNAHRKSHLGGQTGNLIVKLPGTVRRPRRLMMGHIDTVPLCVVYSAQRCGYGAWWR
jgi:tripeptide aminopeptidase